MKVVYNLICAGHGQVDEEFESPEGACEFARTEMHSEDFWIIESEMPILAEQGD
jgi:hypothetical protein